MAISQTSQEFSNLTTMERALLLRLNELDQSLSRKLQEQDSEIEVLKLEIRAQDASITRLTDLLTSLLGPAAAN